MNTDSIVFHQIGTPYIPVKPKVVSTSYDSNFITLKYIDGVNDNKFGLYYSKYIARDTNGLVVTCVRLVRIIDSIQAIINNTEQPSLSIYPNPVNGKQFSIHFGHTIPTKEIIISLIDIQGRQVYYNSFSPGKIDLSLSLDECNLDNGVYMLKIDVGKAVMNKLIIFQ